MRIVALTGAAASGKSTVGSLFRRWGALVISADQLVRELQQPGQPVFDHIIARFGPGVILPDGGLDRPALRSIVLGDVRARVDLEQIVHPAVEQRRRVLLQQAATEGVRLAIIEIPLLFEAADPGAYGAIIVVDAPEAQRRDRLRARGLTEAEIDALLAAQWSSVDRNARASWVINNDGSLERLEERAHVVWAAIQP